MLTKFNKHCNNALTNMEPYCKVFQNNLAGLLQKTKIT